MFNDIVQNMTGSKFLLVKYIIQTPCRYLASAVKSNAPHGKASSCWSEGICANSELKWLLCTMTCCLWETTKWERRLLPQDHCWYNAKHNVLPINNVISWLPTIVKPNPLTLKWLTCNFSLKYPHILQQTGNENTQTYIHFNYKLHSLVHSSLLILIRNVINSHFLCEEKKVKYSSKYMPLLRW